MNFVPNFGDLRVEFLISGFLSKNTCNDYHDLNIDEKHSAIYLTGFQLILMLQNLAFAGSLIWVSKSAKFFQNSNFFFCHLNSMSVDVRYLAPVLD